jgi:predicted permease
MRDFVAHVRRHLSRPEIPDGRYDEVVEELASELEARYAVLLQRGAREEEAWHEVLAQVPSWPALAGELATAAGTGSRTIERRSLVRGSRIMAERWVKDLTVGVRSLRKHRGFALTAIVTLAVCLGGHAAILAGLNAMVFDPLRIPEPDRVLLMANQYPRVESRRATSSATPDYADRLRHVTALEEQAFYNFFGATVDVGGQAIQMRGMVATPSLFRLLRVTPAHGRVFTDDEGTLGNEDKVILTSGLWRELFGGDPSVVGRRLRLGGREFTIVGVLRPDFSFGDADARFWVPLAFTDRQRSDDARHNNGWFSIGRLAPGATIEQAATQLESLDAVNFERTAAPLQQILANTGFYTSVEPLQEVLARDVRRPLFLLWAAAMAVFAIGIVNLGNLALVRSRARLPELGTRLAIGARRLDVIRQLLAEALLVSIAGSAGGLAVGAWLVSILRMRELGSAQLRIDPVVVAITLGLGLFTALVVAAVAALPLYTMNAETMLREGARGGTHGRRVRAARRGMVLAQMACSFVVLMGSALLWTSVRNLLAVDLGFRTANVMTGTVSLGGARFTADDAARSFVDRSLAAIRQLPGIVAAGATTIVPLRGNMQTGIILAEGYAARAGEAPVSGRRAIVTPGYFEAVGTPLVRGRYFEERDNQADSRSIIVDDRLARRFWPDGDAIGRRMFRPANPRELQTMDANTRWLTVVGVVGNARLRGPAVAEGADGTSGTYYLPYAVTAPRDIGLIVHSERESGGVVRDVRSAIARIDRQVPLFDVRTLSERNELALASRTNAMHLAMVFAVVAVFLSAVGLYGVLAYLVAQRAREIGVRLALGSTPRGVVEIVFREGLWLAIGGTALGVALFLTFGRLVASQLYEVRPTDPWLMLLAAATLTAVAALACIIPARRAARVDVLRTLTAQ